MACTTSYPEQLFCGIESGATHTKILIIQHDGNVLLEGSGPGIKTLDEEFEWFGVLHNLIRESVTKAKLDANTKFAGLGMALRGVDTVIIRERVENKFKAEYGHIAEEVYIVCDTTGSLATAFPGGGVVLVAGTGSKCEVLNPDGSMCSVGGIGPIMGDEGSAYWISRYCIKSVLDAENNYVPTDCDLSFVRSAICTHFQVNNTMEALEYVCAKFNLPHFAALTVRIAQGAREKNDQLCCRAFFQAGLLLAQHIAAIIPKVDKSLMKGTGGLQILCVGSVFKSWDLLQEGFLEGLAPTATSHGAVYELTAVRLTKAASYGAAYLVAKRCGIVIPVDYSQNTRDFFHHRQ